jgi:S-DNA-T family DNA segregation ATPase FtsK/SpoIIIE
MSAVTVNKSHGPITDTIIGLAYGLIAALRTLWLFRVELVLLAPFIFMDVVLLHPVLGDPWAPLIALALAAATAAATWSALGPILHRRSVIRRWRFASEDVGLKSRVLKVRPVRAGDELVVTVGDSFPKLELRAPDLAARLKVLDVIPIRHQRGSHRATVLLKRRDPFDTNETLPWPVDLDRSVSIWNDPMPQGVDENGGELTLRLVNEKGARSLLLAGETGSGKSVELAKILAWLSLAHDVERVWLADGGELDTDVWKDAVHAYVGASRLRLVRMLQDVHKSMERKKDLMLAQGKKKVGPGDPVEAVVIDELPFFINAADATEAKLAKKAYELLRDLVARGRKYGFIVCVVAQKPTDKTIPSDLRDLLSYRWSGRALTWQASDVALGPGMAKAGYDASEIREDQKGVGILDSTGARPCRSKGYYLDDEGVEQVARRAAARRAQPGEDRWTPDDEPEGESAAGDGG